MVRSYVLPKIMLLTLVAVSLACSIGSGLNPSGGGSDATTDGVVAGDANPVFDELPPFDPGAPLPSPGAAALRALMVLDPGVAELESDVEAAERAAIGALLADIQAQLTADNGIGPVILASQSGAGKVAILAPNSPAPAGYILIGNPDGINTANEASLIAGMISGLSDIWSPSVEAGAHIDGSVTETEGGATTTSTIELGRGTDGSTVLGMGARTEASKNGISVKTDFGGSVDGMRCPDADGHVSFTVKVRLGAESGGAGYTQDLTAFVRAQVNDDATISSTTFDLTQGTRQVKDGRQVYVETGETVKYDGDDVEGLAYSNVRMIRHSQEATQADATALSAAGHRASLAMARTAIAIARNNWLNGGCTKIEAPSPGTVKPGSTTAIPVVVRHRFDGSVVPSKLKAELAGGQSVDPTSLAKTPGTLTYTAPAEAGKAATITLTATSRRGRATLELAANTSGQAYHAIAPQPAVWSGVACSLDEPFAFSYKGISSGSYAFVPTNAARGRVTWHETVASCELTASGTYVIEPYSTSGQSDIIMDLSGTVTCQGHSAPTGDTRLHILLEQISEPSCP